MKQDTWNLIHCDFLKYPETRARPVLPEEFEEAFAFIPFVIDSDYREFVLRHGGGDVGSYPVYGLRLARSMGQFRGARTAPELTRAFRGDGWPHVANWLVFSFDSSGLPIGFRPEGDVALADRHAGEAIWVADNFEHFLRRYCFQIDG